MKAVDAVAEVLKREGVDVLIAYPGNALIEAAARANIRTIFARQERTGLNIADAIGRLTSGDRIGVFAMQQGPGAENCFGAIAQAFAESVPLLVLAAGYDRRRANLPPNFSSWLNFQHITKWAEQVTLSEEIPSALRRAFTHLRNGRFGPVVLELPIDLLQEDVPEPLLYTPVIRTRSAPDPEAVIEVAGALVHAQRPVIYAGQGVHYAKAWGALRELAELLEAPVTTSLAGKRAFPENRH